MSYAMGDFTEAVKTAEQVIAAAPHHPQAFKLLAAVHEALGDLESSRRAYELAAHADSSDVETWTKLGMLLR